MRGAVWSRWSWLEEVVIPVITAVMYAAWLTLFLGLLLGSGITYPRDLVYPWWAIVGVRLAAGWLARALADRRGGRWVVAAVGAAMVVGSVVAAGGNLSLGGAWRALTALVRFGQGLPAGLVVLLATLGLWFDAARMNWAQHRQLMRGFVTGVLALALLSLAAPGAVQGADLVVFVLSGLLALALQTVASHLAYQVERGRARPPLSRYWLMAMGLAMLGILAAGWVLSLFLAPEAVASLLGRLRPLLAFVGEVIAFVGMLMVWLLYLGYQFVGGLFTREAPPAPAEEPALPAPFGEQLPDLDITPGAPPSLPEGLGVVLLALALTILVVVVVVTAWRRRSRPRYTSTALEEREFIWSKELLLERWRGLFSGPARRRRQELFGEALDLRGPRDRIRQAYRLLLLNAREHGLARRRGQTVTAYRDRVVRAAPTAEAPVDTLSAAYLQARYGDVEPPEGLAQEAQRASEAAVGALAQPRRVGRGAKR